MFKCLTRYTAGSCAPGTLRMVTFVTHLANAPTRSVHHHWPESRWPPVQALGVASMSCVDPLQPLPVRSEPRSPLQLHSCPLVGRPPSNAVVVPLRCCALGRARGGSRASLLPCTNQSGLLPDLSTGERARWKLALKGQGCRLMLNQHERLSFGFVERTDSASR